MFRRSIKLTSPDTRESTTEGCTTETTASHITWRGVGTVQYATSTMKCDSVHVHKERALDGLTPVHVHRCIRCKEHFQTFYPSGTDRTCGSMGLGDRVAYLIRRYMGLAPVSKSCGCEQRQHFLNELDRKIFRYFWSLRHGKEAFTTKTEANPRVRTGRQRHNNPSPVRRRKRCCGQSGGSVPVSHESGKPSK